MSREIIIAGGGPVGMTLALSLASLGIPSTILELREAGSSYQDNRALALSYGTQQILSRLGVWSKIDTFTSIHTIHVSQRGSLGRTLLTAKEEGIPALGYVVSYGALSQALDTVATVHGCVDIHHGTEVFEMTPNMDRIILKTKSASEEMTFKADLAVVADGGRTLGLIPGLSKETKEYGHYAIVAKVHSELAHNYVAYERFTPDGPMALLPNGDCFSLVWTAEQMQIEALMKLNDACFLERLHDHFGDRVGRFTAIGKRMMFPLRLTKLTPAYLPHLAVIGNAAQTMHPVAGQGFNVGIRDAWALANVVYQTKSCDLGNVAMLERYRQLREKDAQRGLDFTDFLVDIFTDKRIGLHTLRSVGLLMLDVCKPAKHALVQKMTYGK